MLLVVGGVVLTHLPGTPPEAVARSSSATPSPRVTPSSPPYVAPTAAQIQALPEARYDAVIAGLVAYRTATVPTAATAVYSIKADAALYGDDRFTPIARLPAKNFLSQDTVVVPVQFDGLWALVLTPARQALPSKSPNAPAQSAGWIRRDLLIKQQDLGPHIEVSLSTQKVMIVSAAGNVLNSFSAGVGAKGTPTPTGVVGYMQARYLDPAQNQRVYPIGLTSLHSSAADEPYGGKDGGLIGIHYEAKRSGAISHGCVRLDGAAVTILDQLPLGTLVVINN